jgi:GR25 family glycosyltransferase involved in LPS biosynthesis
MAKQNRYKYILWLFAFVCISVILLHFVEKRGSGSDRGLLETFGNVSSGQYDIKYYVITMGQPHRIENIQKETDKLNSMAPSGSGHIKFDIVDAVKGDDLDLNRMVKEGKLAKEVINPEGYRGFGVVDKRKYEVGCYLSHIRAYEKIKRGIANGSINPNSYSIIFEDDLEIQDGYFEGLQKGMDYLTSNQKDFDMLFLGLHSEENDLVGSNIYRPNCKGIYNCYYSHAYLIPNSKVDKLLEKMAFIDNTVDIKMISLSESGDLSVFRIMPDIVNQNSPTTGSVIRG